LMIRSAWLDGEMDAAEVRLFTSGDGTRADLAGAFEAAVERADDLADQLRRDADRVATRAARVNRRQSCLDQTAKLAAEREAALRDRDVRLHEWQSQWQPLGIEPLTPREMRAWERKLQTLLQQAEAVRRQQSAVDAFDTRMANCQRELNRALDALGEPATQPGETLAAQLERAQWLADAIDAAAAAHARLTDETAGLERQLDAERAKAAMAERELASWKSRWSVAMAPLGLSADATPAQANEMLAQLETLFRHLAEADGFRERIEGIACEADQFACETRSLLENLGRGRFLDGKTADQAADALLLEYRQATEDRGRLQTLRKQREGQASQVAESKRAAAEARAVLDTLCREAGCDDPANLPELEQRSSRAKELQANERHLHEQLSLLSAGMPLDELVEEVGRVDADDLPNKLDRLSRRISELETERDALLNTITLETKALADMDAGSAAADAEEEAQSLAAQIAGDVETYVRLRLASAVLRAAIERYREKNQGPVLERASRLFAELTVGSFSGLRADYNEQGDAVLVGMRAADGRSVPVDGMSDGTADQLYLALRLASLENYLAEHEPAPFVVDDILINFDNRRSLATLRVLAELSRRTQVIFFTHHEHLVAMAREQLDQDALFVHRLVPHA
ncbi:MAG: ATP-binding protein, partial [Pirellulales bacterium]